VAAVPCSPRPSCPDLYGLRWAGRVEEKGDDPIVRHLYTFWAGLLPYTTVRICQSPRSRGGWAHDTPIWGNLCNTKHLLGRSLTQEGCPRTLPPAFVHRARGGNLCPHCEIPIVVFAALRASKGD